MQREQIFTLLPSDKYIEDFKKELQSASKRILIQSFLVEFTKETADITNIMKEKALQGVEVIVHIDYFSRMKTYSEVFSRAAMRVYREKHAEMESICNDLLAHNVKVIYINKPKTTLHTLFPRLGRNHMKITIIDDMLYIGGVSTAQRFFHYADFMVKTTSPLLIQEVTAQFFRVNEKRLLSDAVIEVDNETTLLIDAGRVGQSVIYDNALQLVRGAKKNIQYISQFVPDFSLLQGLNNAKKRGVNIEIITYHPKFRLDKKFENKVEHMLFKTASKGLTISFYNKSYVHAKLMIIDNEVALFGSHNYSHFGVWFGTDEIAVKTSNHDLIEQLSLWYREKMSECILK